MGNYWQAIAAGLQQSCGCTVAHNISRKFINQYEIVTEFE